MYKWILMASMAVLTMSCSSPSDDTAETTETRPEHVWQDQVDTIDKAREVEKTLLDSQQQRDETLRQQQ